MIGSILRRGRTARGFGRVGRAAADRWQRSLQLRVGATTTVLVGLLALVLGFTLLHQISRGLLDAKLRAAQQDASNGLELARAQLKVINDTDPDALAGTAQRVIIDLARRGSPAGLFDVGVVDLESPGTSWSAGSAELAASVPSDLARLVDSDNLAYAYGPILYPNGSQVAGLVLGGPIHTQHRTLGLYYLFPLTAERSTLALIQRIVLVAGLGLVLFVVLIAVLVTRQVVGPVRLAAGTARRLADGHLEERMQVSGKDDLSLLARSFNEMAGSLQQQITKLEEMSRLQRRFTSDVSHELRTPLTTVRMAADLLFSQREDFAPEVARSAELLHDELGRFEALLTDLLEISRYDAGVAVLEAEPVDVRLLVGRVADAVRTVAEQHGSELLFGLPAEPAIAEVDPRRVERVLRNLLVNAIEHGEGRPVHLTLSRTESTVAVTVRDHGVGLRPGEAGLVFNRFWRADPSRTRRTGGTGLGLAISLEDARLHGGWLHAWGRPGGGAQFRLTLPIGLGGRPLAIEPAAVEEPTPVEEPVPAAGLTAQ
ncbi:MAG: HAMP domain-containing histidine kinase [Actinobacteria bacterium]|nr:HAMP domain-containing histidine kinase [Actinomycetota bacterium]MBI3687824.1 HAMP domain-containing histidine kinase [Actinomycetota bacterium]